MKEGQFDESDLDKLRDLRDDAEGAWHDQRSEIDEKEFYRQGVSKDYDEKKALIEGRREHQTALRDIIDDISADIVTVSNQVEALEEELEVLQSAVALHLEDAPSPDEEARIDAIESELDPLREEEATLREDIGAIIREWMVMPTEIAQLEAEFAGIEAELCDLTINVLPDMKLIANELYHDWQDLIKLVGYWVTKLYGPGYKWIMPVPEDVYDI
jgi:chromosome segregation ATPase